MKKYEIILKNTKLRGYLLSGWLILGLSFIGQLYFSLSGKFRSDRYWVIGTIVVFAALLFLSKSRGKYNFRDKDYVIGFGYAITTLTWLKWQLIVVGIIVFIVYILYYFATRRFQIQFSASNIVYSSFPKRTINWNELTNVIMKDGILTIDFKDNKLMQNETEGDDMINEKEFNEFCREKIKGNS
jgi:hypothetical protein